MYPSSYNNEKKVLPFLAKVVPICEKVAGKEALSEQDKKRYRILCSLIDGFNRLDSTTEYKTVKDLLGAEFPLRSATSGSTTTSGAATTTRPVAAAAAAMAKQLASRKAVIPKAYDSDTDEDFSDTDSDVEDADGQEQNRLAINESCRISHQLVHMIGRTMKHPIRYEYVTEIEDDSESEEESESPTTSGDSTAANSESKDSGTRRTAPNPSKGHSHPGTGGVHTAMNTGSTSLSSQAGHKAIVPYNPATAMMSVPPPIWVS